MTKFLFAFIFILSVNVTFANPEFTAREATSYINKSYEQAKTEVLKKGYKFSKKYDGFYSFQKIKEGTKYTCTLIVKQGKVKGIGTNEYYEEYSTIINDIETNGFIFKQGFAVEYPSGQKTEFDEASTSPIASSMTRFDKQKTLTCFIICPYNLENGTELISINYGIYSAK